MPLRAAAAAIPRAAQLILALVTGAVYWAWQWPLERLFFDGPGFNGWGGWQGQHASDICATLTKVPATAWLRDTSTQAECADLLQRQFYAVFIVANVALYALIVYSAVHGLWYYCVKAPHDAHLLAYALRASIAPSNPPLPPSNPPLPPSNPAAPPSNPAAPPFKPPVPPFKPPVPPFKPPVPPFKPPSTPSSADNASSPDGTSPPLARLDIVLRRAASDSSIDSAAAAATSSSSPLDQIGVLEHTLKHRRSPHTGRRSSNTFSIELRRSARHRSVAEIK